MRLRSRLRGGGRWPAAVVLATGVWFVVAGPVAANEPSPDADGPIEVEDAWWADTVADAMLSGAPSLERNPFAVLVRFASDADGGPVEALLDRIGASVVGAYESGDGTTLHVVETRAGIDRTLDRLRSSSLVLAAEPDLVVRSDALTNDTYEPLLWGLDPGPGLDVAPACVEAAGAATVVVGVIDSGVDITHPDLASVIWTNPGEIPGNGIDDDGNGYIDDVNGWDWVQDDNDPADPHGHGTHVAGTIAAVPDNALGIAGVAPNVEILPLRFLNAGGSGYTSDAIAALDYAIDNGVLLTNNSWGGGSYNSTLVNLIGGSSSHLFVAAAGNSARDTDVSPQYPAAYTAPNILSVASHTSSGGRSGFSNHGLTSVDVSAPRVVDLLDAAREHVRIVERHVDGRPSRERCRRDDARRRSVAHAD